MKKLTIRGIKVYTSNLYDWAYLENKYGIKIPEPLKEIVLEYEGCSILECIYHDTETRLFYQANQFLSIRGENKASIEAIIEGHIVNYGVEGYIPFVIDSGGCDLNISIKPETYGQVWINRFDSGEEDPFEFVCESLEKFIDSLITFEEAILLGY